MMPYCEYYKCKKVAEDKPMLLRMWDSYHHIKNPTHVQKIWLCHKHLKKINKLLGLAPIKETNQT
jgi:hypothetical protein